MESNYDYVTQLFGVSLNSHPECCECSDEEELDPKQKRIAQFSSRLMTWPPNLFACMAVIIRRASAFTRPVHDEGWTKSSTECRRNKSLAWLKMLESHLLEALLKYKGRNFCKELPGLCLPLGCENEVSRLRQDLIDVLKEDVEGFKNAKSVQNKAIELFTIADYACAALGSPKDKPFDFEKYLLFNTCLELRLIDKGSAALFDTARVRILPKVGCTNPGVSLESLSLYLAYTTTEKKVWWRPVRLHAYVRPVGVHKKPDTLRVLLLPFPWSSALTSEPIAASERHMHESTSKQFGYFKYNVPSLAPKDKDSLNAAIDSACKTYSDLRGVILPELSIVEKDLPVLYGAMQRNASLHFMMVGIQSESNGRIVNEFRILTHIEQYRHRKQNRWKLDARQMTDYGVLALDRSKEHWEDVDVTEREIMFLVSSYGAAICPIICEDLARIQSDIHIIKSVGPTLVIAVLQDGPQIDSRWAARHASALADDPGCSVLTVSSAAMVRRSNLQRNPLAREKLAVASWRQPGGAYEPLLMDEAEGGIVLSLEVRDKEVYALSGDMAFGYELRKTGAETIPRTTLLKEPFLEAAEETMPAAPNDDSVLGRATALYTALVHVGRKNSSCGTNDVRKLFEVWHPDMQPTRCSNSSASKFIRHCIDVGGVPMKEEDLEDWVKKTFDKLHLYLCAH